MDLTHTLDTHDILATWAPQKDAYKWALAIIVATQGHSYRKTGAFTLVNENGLQLGVLSGGCLEADIKLTARKCLVLDKVLTKEYDGRDEGDAAYQLGCGGIVWIKFIPLSKANDYLNLADVLVQLQQQHTVHYHLIHDIKQAKPEQVVGTIGMSQNADLRIVINPKIHILIVGGGKDAIPVCQFAKQLGWRVSVWDPRAAYADKYDFHLADNIEKGTPAALAEYATAQRVNFAVLMSHSVEIDADALRHLAAAPLQHIALLGPNNRFKDVVNAADINTANIQATLSGPAGLDIGGDLPSSIGLSIVAKFHALAYGKS